MRTLIETTRLVLRPLQMTDLDRLVALAGDIRVARNLSRMPHPYTQQDGIDWLEKQPDMWTSGQDYAFAVTRPDLGLIGVFGLHWLNRMTLDNSFNWEIGYWLGHDYWGQGYATEAGHAVIQAVMEEFGAQDLVAGYATTNSQSGHVLEKLGFHKVDAIRSLTVLATGEESPTQLMKRNATEPERRPRP